MVHTNFGTAINCIDGRTQIPVINWLKQKYKLDYVDLITEAGPDEIIARRGQELASIKKRVMISVKNHGSQVVAIAGHHDCAGNPVTKERHLLQLKQAVEVILSWNLALKEIVALWVGDGWTVQLVHPLLPP